MPGGSAPEAHPTVHNLTSMKIYTRKGDDGTTGLLGDARRVFKSDPRLECCGTLDELNAAIGITVAMLEKPEESAIINNSTHLSNLIERLQRVQGELFVVGAHLAVPDDRPAPASLPRLDVEMVTRLERDMDTAESRLEPLTAFILPGGTVEAANLHLARAICRRAERLLVGLDQAQSAPPQSLAYLNRLSDWLFVQARFINHLARIDDVPWKPNP